MTTTPPIDPGHGDPGHGDSSHVESPPVESASVESASPALEPVTGDWQRVSPKYIVVDVVGTLISGIVLAVLSCFFLLIGASPVLWALPIGILVITVLYAAFTPRRVRAIGYRMREDDLVVRRGILFRRVVAVPYGRMQLVDITRGPIDRALGLSQLKLVTAAAASNVAIPGLPEKDADRLRDHLVELAESRRAGL